jgi:hypothetical protein
MLSWMLRIVHRLLLMLVAFAIVSAPTAQMTPPATSNVPITMADMPCDMTTPTVSAAHGKPMTPCKGMTPDCIRQMGCVTVSALPAHLLIYEATVQYSIIDYWTAMSKLASLDREPEPLPPRTT